MSTFDSPDNTPRDRQLGAALRAIDEPPTPDTFWDDLSQQLAELDGESLNSTQQQRNNVTTLDSWRKNSSRVLMVAAVAAAALIGALALINPFEGDPTSVQATDDDNSNGDDNTSDDDTSDDDDPVATDDINVVEPVDYDRPYRVTNLPTGSSVVGGDHFIDSLLLSVPVAGSDASGCEGGAVTTLTTLSADGTAGSTQPELQGLNYVVQNNQNRVVLGSQCEEYIDLLHIGSVRSGQLLLETPLPSLFENVDGLAFVGRPVWSADGDTILVNVAGEDNERLLVSINANDGSIGGTETVPQVVLAEIGRASCRERV